MAKNVDLKVPYAQKDAAKALGAWWSRERKCWFVPAGVPLAPFAEWLPAGDWLAQQEKATKRASAPKKERKLSMSSGAMRSREKKSANHAKNGVARPDDAAGKVIVGALYKQAVGAVGLPWV